MAESTLSVGFGDLKSEVGFYLGMGRTVASFSSDDDDFVESIVQSGIRRVYYPPVIATESKQPIVGHVWTWMRPTNTIALTNGDYDYDLPDDFGRLVGKIHFASDSGYSDISEVSVSDLLSMIADDAVSQRPEYFAVRTQESDGSTGQRYEILFYPTPDASYTVSVEYEILPEELSDDAPYPLGGMSLSELYIESCLAVAESKTTGPAEHDKAFTQLLTDAIARDQLLQASKAEAYDAISTDCSYIDLKQKVAIELGYGSQASKWTVAQQNEINSYVQSGVRRVYHPPAITPDIAGYEWSFLRPTTTLSITEDDYDYDLPATFGRINGKFLYNADDYRSPISIISYGDILNMRAAGTTVSAPQYAAIHYKTSDMTAQQRQEVVFYPTPDADYTLRYEYEAYIGPLSDTYLYPLGDESLAELYIESCLALVEAYKNKTPGIHTLNFQQLLTDAVERDKKRGARNYGNIGNQEECPIQFYRANTSGVTYNGESV